jgi:hypothetical protein
MKDLYGYIDYVTRDEIRGWALDENGPAAISVSIDGKPVEAIIERTARPDVRQAYPDWRDSGESGFRLFLPPARLSTRGPMANVRVEARSGQDVRAMVATVPSQIGPDQAADGGLAHWKLRPSPFPPAVMAHIACSSGARWSDLKVWTADAIEEAVEVLLFLFRHGSRRGDGLFAYFSFLSRAARAFDFIAGNFPRITDLKDKSSEGIASDPREHFSMAHHLYTLRSLGVRGDFLEFGCFKGFSTSCLSFACQLLSMRMRVFDSFQGLPPSHSTYYRAGDFAASLEEVTRNVQNFGSIHAVTFHKGYFAEVLPRVKLGPAAAIWLDVDLEASASDAMVVLPRLDAGGCVFCHECLPEHFDKEGNMPAAQNPDSVLAPIAKAFIAGGRDPRGRHLVAYTAAIWDARRSVPPPGPAIVRLFDALLAG